MTEYREEHETATDELDADCTCPPGAFGLGCEVHGWVVGLALAHESGVACDGE